MFVEINPKILQQDFAKIDGRPGVYAWGYKEEDKTFIPLYVGKSRNIFERLIQHYCRFKSGEYSLFRRTDLHNYYCKKQVIKLEKYYEPTDFRKVITLQTDDNHQYMIDNFLFRYFHLEEELLRQQAELFLAKTANRDQNCLLTIVRGNDLNILNEEIKIILKKMVSPNAWLC